MGAELEAMIPTRPWPRTYNITCTHIQRGQVHTPSHYGTHTPDSSSIGYGEWFVGCSKYKGKYLSTSCLYSRPMTRQEKDVREVQVYISSCERTPTRKKPRKRRRPSPQQRDVVEIRIVPSPAIDPRHYINNNPTTERFIHLKKQANTS